MSGEIVIPDFTKMSDDELHGWEFAVYDLTADDPRFKDADLAGIIGEERAREYYKLRGQRIDVARLIQVDADLATLLAERDQLVDRIGNGRSGEYHFPSGKELPQ